MTPYEQALYSSLYADPRLRQVGNPMQPQNGGMADVIRGQRPSTAYQPSEGLARLQGMLGTGQGDDPFLGGGAQASVPDVRGLPRPGNVQPSSPVGPGYSEQDVDPRATALAQARMRQQSNNVDMDTLNLRARVQSEKTPTYGYRGVQSQISGIQRRLGGYSPTEQLMRRSATLPASQRRLLAAATPGDLPGGGDGRRPYAERLAMAQANLAAKAAARGQNLASMPDAAPAGARQMAPQQEPQSVQRRRQQIQALQERRAQMLAQRAAMFRNRARYVR